MTAASCGEGASAAVNGAIMAGRFGVTRFLAAAFRFFAIAWSSFDGVANSRHCTHEFWSTDFKTNQPRDLAAPARNIETESLRGGYPIRMADG